MNILWILIAYVLGFGARALSLPPLIGFLAAGFALNFMGVQGDQTLTTLADTGITLMLFTIGLKLNIKDLLKPEIWAGTLLHAGIWTLLVGSVLAFAAALSLPYVGTLSLKTAALIAFALSFSSTICIIKILEDSGEIGTRHGKLCVGVLVAQDLVAVIFLAIATGKVPSPWALLLFGLFFAKPVVGFLLDRSGHGEVLPLGGFLLALGGYQLFELVGVKGDLGALLLGTAISAHPKAAELAKSLLSFKDLFLIAFFLSIGLTALPDTGMLITGAAIGLFLIAKMALFFFIFVRLRLRSRTAYLSSLALGNYSEFGLIVAYLCVQSGWLTQEWLVILAIAVSVSFIVTAGVYRSAHSIYARFKDVFRRFQHPDRLPADQVFRPKEAEILVIGTGRTGRGAFKSLYEQVGDRVWGMDANREQIAQQQAQGMHVFAADAENADIWEAIDTSTLKLVLIAVNSIADNKNITTQLRLAGYKGPIAAIAQYEDERAALAAAGIDKVFNFYTEAGSAFASDSLALIERPA